MKERKKTTTIRISWEIKERLDYVKGSLSYDKLLDNLVDFFLNKK